VTQAGVWATFCLFHSPVS